MKPLIHLKKPTLPLVITCVLGCFALLSTVKAVSPPPDGCYPGLTTAEGCNALFSLATGQGNTAIGHDALFSDTTGSWNTSVGAVALGFNDGDFNTAVGTAALLLNTTGAQNTAVGAVALLNNTDGSDNTAIGRSALINHATGDANVAIGNTALFNHTTGSDNTAIGRDTLFFSTGNGNTALGAGAGASVTTANNVICIRAPGANVDNSCFIGNIYFNVQPIVGTDPDSVTITSSGRLGRGNVSSRRYKHDIQPMDRASEALYALNPVSFRYNKEYDATQTLAFGLIAEEVAEVYPDLVGRNSRGEPESVRYDQVNAMLLNEFLKEHKTVQEQGATIAGLQKQIETLAASLQKVSAQLELSKSAPRTVLNNQ
jgi:hypothetical protein